MRLHLAGIGRLSAVKACIREKPESAETGTRLLGAVDALIEATGGPLVGDEARVYALGRTIACEVLGQAEFGRAWPEGRAMSLDQTVALAQGIT